jgi:hypothetical protein
VGRDIHLIFVLNLKSNQNGISSSRKLAKSLMLKHGLEEWSFAWDNSKKRFGVCKYRRLNSGYAPTGTIGLSRLLVEVNDVIQVTDTIYMK